MKKRGKWRRAEEQLTGAQRRKIAEMLRDGYTVAAIMDRFGLTDKEQVLDFYADPCVSDYSPLDSIGAAFSTRTTFADVARDHVWKGMRTKLTVDNSW